MDAGYVVAGAMWLTGVGVLVTVTVHDIRTKRRERAAASQHDKIARQLDDCACEATQGHREA